ncbi:F-box-like domain superfamily [Sesbania bispinosa]|nr:F-box-like domain superfamily [Sesbania bispinosa]
MASKQLDEDLIEESLVRLPVKSLVRFRSLNKACNTLITKNSFITEHFSRSTLIAKNKPSFLIFHVRDSQIFITLVSDNEQSQPLIDLTPSFLIQEGIDNIVAHGPCNGLFCLEVTAVYKCDQLMLWNPATREIKLLPLALPMECSHWTYLYMVYGFGFDSKTNDYKVVNIVTGVKNDITESQNPLAQVYSLRTNSWKMIDIIVPANNIINSTYTSHLNGKYHWLIKSHNDESILCFDMSDEVFWKMNLPPISPIDANEPPNNTNIAVFDDHLAYVKEYFSSSLGTCFEIWIMNEYNVEESWTKRFTIGPYLSQWKFWGFWKDDEVLMEGPHDIPLVLINIGQQRLVREFPDNLGMGFHAFRYVESIVPLSNLINEEET